MKTAEVKKENGVPEKVELKINNGTAVVAKPLSIIRESEKVPTALSRIQKSEQFQILGDRHQKLVSKKSELEKFIIGDDGLQGCTLILKNANGKSFEISNGGVIKEVLVYAKTKLNSLIEISEAEVLGFTI